MTALTRAVLCCFLISSLSLLADSPQGPSLREPNAHPAGEWTLEERLAARFDPVKIQERETAYLLDHPRDRSRAYESEGKMEHPDRYMVSYRIDGRRNPELFLPHELFDILLSGFVQDATLRERQRGFCRQAIRDFGFDDTLFWAHLYPLVGTYLTLKYDRSKNVQPGRADEVCRARYDALQAAREFFGPDEFNRFLYVVIAPSAWSASTTNVRDPATRLLRAERGCQP